MKYMNYIKINGFKRLVEIELSLKPLTVMIGSNGVGKTSFLEVMTCLAAIAEGKLNSQLSNYGGYTSVISLDKQNFIGIDAGFDFETIMFGYEISLASSGIAYTIEREKVTAETSAGIETILDRISDIVHYTNIKDKRTSFSLAALNESALSQLPSNTKGLDDLQSFLSRYSYNQSIWIAPRSPIRTPQPIKPTMLPGVNGEDLISCLYNIRVTDRDRFELITDCLRAAFPGLDYIEFPSVAAGTLSLIWKDKQFTQPLYPHQLSEGTLRFLWLTALLYSPELPAVTLIDEPEVSLHPRMLSLLADMLREASQRAQIIVATQSESLVRFMRPEEVLVMDLDEEGHTTAKWADEMELGDWLEDYTLEKLWRIGLLEER